MAGAAGRVRNRRKRPRCRAGGRTGNLVDLIWYLPLVWLAGRMGGVLRRQSVRRRMEQISGAVLVGLGLRLAAES